MAVSKRKALPFGLLAALSLSIPTLAQAHPRNIGLGVMVGAPTGLSGKAWLDEVHAIDFAVGSFGYYVGQQYNELNVHADYLWHMFGVFGDRGSNAYSHLPLYLGVGGVFNSPSVAGVRGVMGITYLFDQPFDAFFEIAPTLVLAPGVGFGTDAGLGARYYF